MVVEGREGEERNETKGCDSPEGGVDASCTKEQTKRIPEYDTLTDRGQKWETQVTREGGEGELYMISKMNVG